MRPAGTTSEYWEGDRDKEREKELDIQKSSSYPIKKQDKNIQLKYLLSDEAPNNEFGELKFEENPESKANSKSGQTIN